MLKGVLGVAGEEGTLSDCRFADHDDLESGVFGLGYSSAIAHVCGYNITALFNFIIFLIS
jgi:hypothetical protein